MVSSRIQFHDDILDATCRRFDVDNTGYIDAANLKQVLGDTIPDAEINEIIKAHDGRIEYQEWIAYLRGGCACEHHCAAAAKIIDSELISFEYARKLSKMHTRDLLKPAKPTGGGGVRVCICVGVCVVGLGVASIKFGGFGLRHSRAAAAA
eukprot:NODE_4229_length_696_cov_217.873635.p1 GENE.NODE_4229_length_696_cov_217.873635~~NODE_4229_length_696_cov_217.873635.p1  ORF type:complete len:151 (-),score=41.17 NODE_4229_length_696_cov_217.873635:156-608(-)